jgi:t-SNARE complex subunit (syntaxin)
MEVSKDKGFWAEFNRAFNRMEPAGKKRIFVIITIAIIIMIVLNFIG